MLRRNFQMTANMIIYQLAQKCIAFIQQHIIITQAGADKHLFNAGQRRHLTQQTHVFMHIRLQIFARLRIQAFFIATGTNLARLGTTLTAEIGGGTTQIMNIALKIGLLGQPLGLRQNALRTAVLDNRPLMMTD